MIVRKEFVEGFSELEAIINSLSGFNVADVSSRLSSLEETVGELKHILDTITKDD